jgi:selenoprotein W-related protein
MADDRTRHRIIIYYCPLCRWLARATWTVQELLSTFEEELFEVALRPGDKGQFDIYVDDEIISCRETDGGFPELKVLKQRIRDLISPDKPLGHSDAQ